jgi:hypothetical protein
LIYGGTFVLDGNGVDYSNGSVNALRTFDTNGGDEMIHIVLGDPTNIDQIWTDGTAMVTAEAKYADFGQSFGWNQGGTTGSGYTELLTDADVGGTAVDIMIDGDFLWAINPSSGDTWWSRNSQNSDYVDHMLTYKIEGLPGGETVWLLFWEDLPFSTTDADFNDFVVEIRAIPEPGSAFLLGAGLLALAAWRRR